MTLELRYIGGTIIEMTINTDSAKITETITHLHTDKVDDELIENLEDILAQLKEWNEKLKKII